MVLKRNLISMAAVALVLAGLFWYSAEASQGYVSVGLTKHKSVASANIGTAAINVYTDIYSPPVYTFESGEGFILSPAEGGFAIWQGGQQLCVISAPFIQGANGITSVGGAAYRGYIRPIMANGAMTITNYVSAEEYLYSVVPSEMPASWHLEALKAQAVAARSYMHTQAGVHASEGYDLCDTIDCQVYLGVSGEDPRSTEAVSQTSGIMAYYDGEPINAVFASSSGGATENSENVWANAVPYLRGVREIAENETRLWTKTYTLEQIAAGLMANGAGVGSVISVTAEYLPSGRVSKLTFTGTGGTKTYEKDAVRSFSNRIDGSLLSTLFKINGYCWSDNGVWDSAGGSGGAAGGGAGELYLYGARSFSSVKGNPDIFVTAKDGAAAKHSGSLSILAAEGRQVSYSGSSQGSAAPLSTSTETKSFTITSGIITLEGRGYGHGVGMSQYGAKGMAENGYDYIAILKHYYSGIEIR